jgi:hypothetical protein
LLTLKASKICSTKLHENFENVQAGGIKGWANASKIYRMCFVEKTSFLPHFPNKTTSVAAAWKPQKTSLPHCSICLV